MNETLSNYTVCIAWQNTIHKNTIRRTVYIKFRDVFRTLSNIYDGALL